MEMSLPGGSVVPIAGLTWVGVHPDVRRRGVLAAMMADHLARTHDAGMAISALHASEAGIYGRFGYGMAALQLQVSVGRGTTFTAPHLEDEVAGITTQLVTMAAPGVAERMRACQSALAADFPGTIVGSPDFFSLLAFEPAEALRDKEPRRVLFARRDGEDVGFVGLRREHKWDHARPSGTVTVGTFCGTPAARLALARRVVDLDLMGTTKLENIGADDPLLGWVGGPRDTGDLQTWDSTWVRLVDLGAAWSLRTFEGDCDVVVEVVDRHAPWNAGTWRLSASGGRGDGRAHARRRRGGARRGRAGGGLPGPRHRRPAARRPGARAPGGCVRRAGDEPCVRRSRRSRRSGSEAPRLGPTSGMGALQCTCSSDRPNASSPATSAAGCSSRTARSR